MKFNTKTIHGGQQPDKAYGAVMTPIYQTSTFVQSAPGVHQGYEYARSANPTRTALENALVSLESGIAAMAFESGLAAIDAVLKLMQSGDEVLACRDLYGGTYRLFTKVYNSYGIKFKFVDLTDLDEVEKHINSNTKLIWIETPTNPLLQILDIKALAALAKSKNIWLGVDNTFASPYLQQPLDLGADIVMHSATKYLGGHSDVILGALVVKDQELAERIRFIQNASGAVPGPMDCFLVLRGIKTLSVRMQRHCENAKVIAEYLNQHPKVKQVYWPGFKSHNNYEVAKSQMKDFGGMLSFVLESEDQQAGLKMLSRLKLFSLAESLGGVESLAGHPVTMTHASVPEEERLALGIVNNLIRLSVGIEDVEDLTVDLEQALNFF